MAKDKITDYSATAASNTDTGGVDIQGTAPASNMDDSVREVMSHLAETNAGSAPWADSMTIGDTADLTKEVRFELSGITTGTTRVLTVPNFDGTIATLAGTETLSNKTFTLPQINDTSADHQYVFAVSELAADRTVTMPLLAGNDTFVFADFIQTLKNKKLEDSTTTIIDNSDATKIGAFQLSGVTTGNTRTLTWPDASGTIALTADVAARGGTPDVVMEDQKAAGTNGGSSTSGSWQTRTLNTEVRDTYSLASLSSNEVTFTAAGWVEWSAGAFESEQHQSRLYNVTDATVAGYGTCMTAGGGTGQYNESVGGAAVVAGKAYRIEHRVTGSKATNGYGRANNFGGTEVYVRLQYWRSA